MRSSNFLRQADRRAGAAVAALLGPLLSRRQMPRAPKRIIFIQPTAIGDTLIASACLLALAERFEEAELIVAHGPGNAAAVRMLKAPVVPVQVGFSNPASAVRNLRALEPDMVVDLCPWPFATALAARLSSPWCAGFVPAGSRRGKLFDLAVPHRTDRHEIENLSAMGKALEAFPRRGMAIRRDPVAPPPGLDPHSLILCHVSAGGAGAAVKSWPDAHWAALINGFATRGYTIGLTGTPADTQMVRRILDAAALPDDRAFSLCGTLSLPALAELLANVALLVSVDTGVLHLSAAVDGRAIGLHGPTKTARWGSISPFARGLDAPHPDAGYMNYGAEDHPSAHALMETISPARVLACVDAMLNSGRAAA